MTAPDVIDVDVVDEEAEAERDTAEAVARIEEREAEAKPGGLEHVPADRLEAHADNALEALNPARRAVTMLGALTELAARLAGTDFVPKGLRGNPPAVLAAILTGQELGIGPMQSLAHINVVDGKPTQSSELMRALIMKAGHRFAIRKWTRTEAVVWGRRADNGDELEVEFTLEDAVAAELCTIGQNGRARARSQGGKPLPWETFTDAMLLARATSKLARAMFADVLGGVSYTPEELGAEVTIDADGRTVLADDDVATPAAGSSSSEAGLGWTAAGDRVAALKPSAVAAECQRLGIPVARQSTDQLRAALTQRLAEGTDGGPAEDPPTEAPQEAPGAPEEPAGPDGAEEAPEAQEATHSPESGERDRPWEAEEGFDPMVDHCETCGATAERAGVAELPIGPDGLPYCPQHEPPARST